jgi:hypothetical protein
VFLPQLTQTIIMYVSVIPIYTFSFFCDNNEPMKASLCDELYKRITSVLSTLLMGNNVLGIYSAVIIDLFERNLPAIPENVFLLEKSEKLLN